MSKIGRRPIPLAGVSVELSNGVVEYSGKNAKGRYELPDLLQAALVNGALVISATKITSDTNRLWGLHRALLANRIKGAGEGFEKKVTIVGLGFKAIKKAASELEFSLGFSHKILFSIPEGVKVEIDKTGQLLTVWSSDRELLGHCCSQICALRPPEPYKGKGIRYDGEVIVQKEGKKK
jgi:large subunit ribosomal protein L6